MYVMDSFVEVVGCIFDELNVGLIFGGGVFGGFGIGLRLIGVKLRLWYEVVVEYIDL